MYRARLQAVCTILRQHENFWAFIIDVTTFVTREYHRFKRNAIGRGACLNAHWMADRTATKLQHNIVTEEIKQLMHLPRVDAA